MPPSPSRGGRPARLSRELVVARALDLVDARGLDGLTMRGLARELDADPMAVYRHVRDKADLLGAMCDAVVADLPAMDLDGAWRPQVRALAGLLRARLSRHPGLLPVLAGAPATPASLAATQQVLELLVRRGVAPADAATGFGAVFSFVLGHVLIEAALPPLGPDRDALRGGALGHLGDPPEPPPQLDEALALLEDAGPFDDGLDLILDGMERRAAGS